MSDIFVSYKSEDRKRVEPIVDALIAEGFSVWWDVHIEAGTDWRERIKQALQSAACVLVVWTETSAGSSGQFVQDEAERAKKRGIYLPIAIDAVEAPLGFGQDQILELVGWRGNRKDPRFVDVIEAARAIVAGKQRPTMSARRMPQRTANLRWIRWLPIAAGMVLLGAILTFVVEPSRICRSVGITCGAVSLANAAPQNSIAVLPFTNLSGDPAQDYLSDGLAEDLIAALTRNGALQVMGRTSTFKFKGSKDDSATIGSRLGVAYLLDGSVRRDGDTLRVSADLIEAKTGFQRWAQTYDRPMKDVLSIQGDIAALVAEALKAKMTEAGPTSTGGTNNATAFDAYLQGRQLLATSGSESEYRKAIAQFDAALAADPEYALAHAARSRALLAIAAQFAQGRTMQTLVADGLREAQRAVDLAPDLALARSALATARAIGRLDMAGAAEPFEQSWRLAPGDPAILMSFGAYQSDIGQNDQAITVLRRAAVLDPLNPNVQRFLGIAYYFAGRYPEAIDAFRAALAINPHMALAHGYMGHVLYLQNKLLEARAEYALEPSFWSKVGFALVDNRNGDKTAATRGLANIRQLVNETTFYQQAEVLAQWGQQDQAVEALEHAYSARDSGLLQLRSDPLLNPLKDNPGYRNLLRRLGFV